MHGALHLAMSEHRPRRTCMGCGERDDKAVLLRLVLKETGELVVDGLGVGRGGYLHEREGCWENFLRKKRHHRAFRREVEREAREKLVRGLQERYRK